MKGSFIVLEGPDGSGTTTHAELLTKALQAQGIDAIFTREPTEGPIGKFIRAELAKGTIAADTLQILFTADRAAHIHDVIEVALNEGKTVISDRYALSTLIYGEALGLDGEWLQDMNANFLQPDKLIIALPSFETCRNRMNERETKDMLEAEDSLQKRVYDGYANYASKYHVQVLDTSGTLEEAGEKLMALVAQ